MRKITVDCNDPENSLLRLLECIKKTGNVGHSFSIVVDPEDQGEKFFWDGDGADRIDQVEVVELKGRRDAIARKLV